MKNKTLKYTTNLKKNETYRPIQSDYSININNTSSTNTSNSKHRLNRTKPSATIPTRQPKRNSRKDYSNHISYDSTDNISNQIQWLCSSRMSWHSTLCFLRRQLPNRTVWLYNIRTVITKLTSNAKKVTN